MEAITATSALTLKMGVSNKQNVSTCLSFGVIAENRSKMVAILNFKMAATRGREYVGGIFSSSPWSGLPLFKVSCLLQKLNDSGVCRSTKTLGVETASIWIYTAITLFT